MRGRKTGNNTNICIDCKKALGGCSWTEVDVNTNQVKFEPIPGWTAEKRVLMDCRVFGKRRIIETYHITACPQFVRG